MKESNYHKYIKIMDLLHINYYRIGKDKLQRLLNQDRIDINKCFVNLKDSQPLVPIRDVDNYIVNNSNLWKCYKKDMFFQYSYVLVGKYTFSNKKEFLKILNNIYCSLKNLDIENIKKNIKEISKKEKTKFILDEKQKSITNKLNNIFQNPSLLNIIEKKLNDKESFCNVFESNIETVESLIEKIIVIVILFNDTLNVQELISIIIQDKNIDEYIYRLLIKQLKIEDENNKEEKIKILDFLYQSFVKEGYYFHGTNSINKQSILNNGFSSNKVPIMKKSIEEINKIFEQHNLYMNFEGKMREIELYQYYVTDSIKSSIMYAFQSPEYLSRFCSNGYHQEDIKRFDREAFWRRDFKSCQKNIEILCNDNKFTEEEKEKVFKNFKDLWNFNVKDGEVPIIFMGKRKNIGRDYSQKYDRVYNNIDNYTAKDIFNLFILGDNKHDKRLSNINPESLSYFSLPNIYKMYHLTSFDKSLSHQYMLYNNKKYYPDIIIDKLPLKKIGIIIDEKIKNPMIISNELVIISQNKRTNIIFLNDYCKININILIAESGRTITKKGQTIIDNLREKLSIENIIKYNKDMIKKCLNYLDKNYCDLEDEQKMLFVHFFVNQLLVKTISMKKYDKYYVNIDNALNRLIYFSIDKEDKLNKMIKQKVIDIDFIENIIKVIKEKIKEYKL